MGTTFPCDISVCAQTRGQGTEVTTTYHIRSDFHLKLCSYHNGLIVSFLCYLSRKHKTYRYSVQLCTCCWLNNILSCVWWFVILVWECNHVISSIVKLNGSLERRTRGACLLLFQDHNWVVGSSYHITQKGTLRSFIQYTKEWPFQNKNRQHEENVLDEYFSYFKHQ